MSAARERSAPQDVAMFPLGTVLFPYQQMPLHVFEPRYRAMVDDCLAMVDEGTAPSFGVVLIERGSEVGGGDQRFDIGTFAHITDIQRSDDGRYGLLVRGAARLRVLEWRGEDPYPRASVSTLGDGEPTDEHAVRMHAHSVAGVVREVLELRQTVLGMGADAIPSLDARLDTLLKGPVDITSYALSLLAGLGAFDAQTLLAFDTAGDRLDHLSTLLSEERDDLQAQLDR